MEPDDVGRGVGDFRTVPAAATSIGDPHDEQKRASSAMSAEHVAQAAMAE
jgi:hypothetical protein